MLGLQRANVPV